jgi:hypothetical protein
MCPQNKKWGQVAHINNPATSGTQNAGEPSANEGGKSPESTREGENGAPKHLLSLALKTQFLLIAKHPFLRYNGLKILGGNGREVDLPSG